MSIAEINFAENKKNKDSTRKKHLFSIDIFIHLWYTIQKHRPNSFLKGSIQMKIKTKIAAIILSAICLQTSCAKSTENLLPFHDPDEFDSRFPKGVQAETIYIIDSYSDLSENLLIASLQGLAAKNSTEQILIKWGDIDYYLPKITEKWGTVLTETLNGEEITLNALTEHYKTIINGYILCDSQNGDTVNTAISLAGILNAAIATEKTKDMLESYGYTCVLDVSDKGDKWLRNSEYWKMLNRDIAIEQLYTSAPRLVDYAILSNAYFNFYNGKNQEKHTKMFDFLNDNAIVLGWNNILGEVETIKSFSSLNSQMIPADHATNLSTLSGFKLEKLTQKTINSEINTENTHTVCIIMSDGDNLQWALRYYANNPYFFASEHRGDFKMGWGLPPSSIDLIAPVSEYFYDNMSENDEFIMQLSGLGYTLPSLWDEPVRLEMAEQLAQYMSRHNTRFVEILDDEGFSTEVLSAFTSQEEIDGIFYIGYPDYYRGQNGEVLWSDGKPIVSARYSLWANVSDGKSELDYIAEQINSASTDVKSTDSYSFIIVHAWSGLVDGQFVPDGNTMDAVAELVRRFNENVEVVTPTEFMDKLIKNCKPQ